MECVFNRWSPVIGDPTFMGWVTVILYFVTALFVFSRIPPSVGRERVFWISLSVLLIALGVNKQFDLQTLFTTIGRCAAKAEGWYSQRRHVQIAFILMLAGGAMAIGASTLWFLRRDLPRMSIALIGAFILVGFVVLRASSFHHMDLFINTRLIGLRLNWIMEIGALAVIIAGVRLQRPRL
jgi:hypothetical protein